MVAEKEATEDGQSHTSYFKIICLDCHIMHNLNGMLQSLAVHIKDICATLPHGAVKTPSPSTVASVSADPYPSVPYVSCVTYCFPIPNKVAE